MKYPACIHDCLTISRHYTQSKRANTLHGPPLPPLMIIKWARIRVWKGVFGIRDLTKIPCGNRENAKYIDGIRELTASRGVGLSRIWARDAGILV